MKSFKQARLTLLAAALGTFYLILAPHKSPANQCKKICKNQVNTTLHKLDMSDPDTQKGIDECCSAEITTGETLDFDKENPDNICEKAMSQKNTECTDSNTDFSSNSAGLAVSKQAETTGKQIFEDCTEAIEHCKTQCKANKDAICKQIQESLCNKLTTNTNATLTSGYYIHQPNDKTKRLSQEEIDQLAFAAAHLEIKSIPNCKSESDEAFLTGLDANVIGPAIAASSVLCQMGIISACKNGEGGGGDDTTREQSCLAGGGAWIKESKTCQPPPGGGPGAGLGTTGLNITPEPHHDPSNSPTKGEGEEDPGSKAGPGGLNPLALPSGRGGKGSTNRGAAPPWSQAGGIFGGGGPAAKNPGLSSHKQNQEDEEEDPYLKTKGRFSGSGGGGSAGRSNLNKNPRYKAYRNKLKREIAGKKSKTAKANGKANKAGPHKSLFEQASLLNRMHCQRASCL